MQFSDIKIIWNPESLSNLRQNKDSKNLIGQRKRPSFQKETRQIFIGGYYTTLFLKIQYDYIGDAKTGKRADGFVTHLFLSPVNNCKYITLNHLGISASMGYLCLFFHPTLITEKYYTFNIKVYPI